MNDHTIKFAKWQHPAMGSGARFAVPIAPLVEVCSLYFLIGGSVVKARNQAIDWGGVVYRAPYVWGVGGVSPTGGGA